MEKFWLDYGRITVECLLTQVILLPKKLDQVMSLEAKILLIITPNKIEDVNETENRKQVFFYDIFNSPFFPVVDN